MKTVTLSRRIHFSSGHSYSHPEWTSEKNKEVFGSSFSLHGHGHNYTLEATVNGPIAPETGMVINLTDLDLILEEVSSLLDHKHLNKHNEHFSKTIPTTENIALYCFDNIAQRLQPHSGVSLFKVRVFESEDLWADCYAK